MNENTEEHFQQSDQSIVWRRHDQSHWNIETGDEEGQAEVAEWHAEGQGGQFQETDAFEDFPVDDSAVEDVDESELDQGVDGVGQDEQENGVFGF